MKKAFSILCGILLLWMAPKTQAQSFWKPYGLPTMPLANHSGLLYLPSSQALLVSSHNAGIFRSTDHGTSWQHVLALAKDQPIFSLYATRRGTVLAGGHGILYVSQTNGDQWEEIAIDSVDVQKLVEDDQGSLYLCSWTRGVLRSTDQGLSWQAWNAGLPNAVVNDLASDGQGNLFCAVVDEDSQGIGGVYYWDKALGRWEQKPMRITLGGISYPMRVDYVNAMVVSPQGQLYVSTTGTVANFSVSGLFKNSLAGTVQQAIWQQERLNENDPTPFPVVLDQLYFTSTGDVVGSRFSTSSVGIYTRMHYHLQWSQQEAGLRLITQAHAYFCELPDGSLLLTTQYSNQLYLTRESQPGKRIQTLAFDSIPPMRLYEKTTLSARASSSLPVQFKSLDNNQAELTGNQLRAVGLGRAGVKAYLDGNDSLYYAEAIRRFLIGKARNVIELTPIPDLQEGEEGITLRAMASSGLEANLQIVKGPALITDRQLIPQGAGRVELMATEPGNATYSAADTVRVNFCVLPIKPSITVVNDAQTGGFTLLSSRETGNQWYFKGSRLPDEGKSLTPRESGPYTLRTGVDGCFSEFSDEVSITVTGLEDDTFRRTIKVYPIPFQERLNIEKTFSDRNEAGQITLTDAYGRTVVSQQWGHQAIEQVSTSLLPVGLYLIKVALDQRVAVFKVVKQP